MITACRRLFIYFSLRPAACKALSAAQAPGEQVLELDGRFRQSFGEESEVET